MSKRKATAQQQAQPSVYPVLIEGRDTLKERARALSLRAIRYNNGHVRLRPLEGGSPTDFDTAAMADDYLAVRERRA